MDSPIICLTQCNDVTGLIGLYLSPTVIDGLIKSELMLEAKEYLSFALWGKEEFWRNYYQTHICSTLGLINGNNYRNVVLQIYNQLPSYSANSSQISNKRLTEEFIDLVKNGYDRLLINFIHRYRTGEFAGEIDFNCGNRRGSSPLMQLINGNFGSVRYCQGLPGKTRVIITMKIIKILLEIPELNINHQNLYGFTPLMAAACHNRVDIARLLIEAGADIYSKDTQGNNRDETALHYASKYGNIEIVEMLIARAKTNDRLIRHIPAYYGQVPSISEGPEIDGTRIEPSSEYINAMTLKGKTALYECVEGEARSPGWFVGSKFWLRETKAVRDRLDAIKNKWTPKQFRKRRHGRWEGNYRYGYREVIIALINAGGDPNITTYSMKHLFTIAIRYRRYDVVELLLNLCGHRNSLVKINLDHVNIFGTNLMMCLSQYGDRKMMELVINNSQHLTKADIRRMCLNVNFAGYNPLLYATDHANIELIEFFLDPDLGLAEFDNYVNSVTPLGHNALARGSNVMMGEADRLATARLLINRGIDINRKNVIGLTPIMRLLCNKEDGNDGLIHLLLDEPNIDITQRCHEDSFNALMISLEGQFPQSIASRLISMYSKIKFPKPRSGSSNKECDNRADDTDVRIYCQDDMKNQHEMILGTNINGSNPLMVACIYGHVGAVFHLLNYCNDFECMKIMLTQANNDGHTPLTISIIYGRELIISLLFIAVKNRSSKGCNGERKEIIDLSNCNPSPIEVIEKMDNPNPRIVRMIHEYMSHKNGSNVI